jgi:hypothetical protein
MLSEIIDLSFVLFIYNLSFMKFVFYLNSLRPDQAFIETIVVTGIDLYLWRFAVRITLLHN